MQYIYMEKTNYDKNKTAAIVLFEIESARHTLFLNC